MLQNSLTFFCTLVKERKYMFSSRILVSSEIDRNLIEQACVSFHSYRDA